MRDAASSGTSAPVLAPAAVLAIASAAGSSFTVIANHNTVDLGPWTELYLYIRASGI